MVGLITRASVLTAVALERLVELHVSKRHAASSLAKGAREFGQDHYPYMVALHVGLLAGSAIEGFRRHRDSPPPHAAKMIALVALAQGLRWWAVASLGQQWSTRVIVMPGASRVTRGPYRLMRHPNYAAVVIEGAVLPLACGAPLTAASFTLANACLLRKRIACEESALKLLKSAATKEGLNEPDAPR